MIRKLAGFWVAWAVWAVGAHLAFAATGTFPLLSGGDISGEPMAADGRGVVIKRGEGDYSDRIPWTNFTQSALQQISKLLPKARSYVEPLLEIDIPEPVKKAAAEIKLKEGPRVARPDPRAGWGALFTSPVMILMFALLYLANIYAAYEVSAFRNYPSVLVCGVAAAVPVVGPVLFLCLPTRVKLSEEDLAAQQAQEEAVRAYREATFKVGSGAEEAAQAAAAAPGAYPPPQIFTRGQTMFNRRFFETKLAGFLRVVPSDEDKDMVVCVRSARGDFVGTRLARVLPNEIYLLVTKGGATHDVMIPYGEINEIKIKHKDAP
jgi:hypothetical protein